MPGLRFSVFIVLILVAANVCSAAESSASSSSRLSFATKCIVVAKALTYEMVSLWIPLNEIRANRKYQRELRDQIRRDSHSERLAILRSKESSQATQIRDAFLSTIKASINRERLSDFLSYGARTDILRDLQDIAGGSDHFVRLIWDRMLHSIQKGHAVVLETPSLKGSSHLMVFEDYQIAFQYDPATKQIKRKVLLFLTESEIQMRTNIVANRPARTQGTNGSDTKALTVFSASPPISHDNTEAISTPAPREALILDPEAPAWLNRFYDKNERQAEFLLEVAILLNENPDLVENDAFKSSVKAILRRDLSSEIALHELTFEVAKIRGEIPKPQQEATKTTPASSLNLRIKDPSFDVEHLVAGEVYSFFFIDRPEVEQKVMLTAEAIEFMKVHRHGMRWLRYFFKPARKHGDSGLRTTAGPNHPYTHSVAIMGSKNNDRLGVVFNRETGLWTIQRAYDHDIVYGH